MSAEEVEALTPETAERRCREAEKSLRRAADEFFVAFESNPAVSTESVVGALMEQDKIHREAVPVLLDELERLRAEIEKHRELKEAAVDWLRLWKSEGEEGHPVDMTAEPDWPRVEERLVSAVDALS